MASPTCLTVGRAARPGGCEGDGEIEPPLIEETVADHLPMVQGITEDDRFASDEEPVGIQPGELATYAMEKHGQRLTQIADASADIPAVSELVSIDESD